MDICVNGGTSLNAASYTAQSVTQSTAQSITQNAAQSVIQSVQTTGKNTAQSNVAVQDSKTLTDTLTLSNAFSIGTGGSAGENTEKSARELAKEKKEEARAAKENEKAALKNFFQNIIKENAGRFTDKFGNPVVKPKEKADLSSLIGKKGSASGKITVKSGRVVIDGQSYKAVSMTKDEIKPGTPIVVVAANDDVLIVKAMTLYDITEKDMRGE